mmetsp:Transcript_12796/g.20233  ORF Transcript_12796/g.20233 Transcript_12796/m.20233 type:complete len:222 (-) Transcript_12796:47-712(-)
MYSCRSWKVPVPQPSTLSPVKSAFSSWRKRQTWSLACPGVKSTRSRAPSQRRTSPSTRPDTGSSCSSLSGLQPPPRSPGPRSPAAVPSGGRYFRTGTWLPKCRSSSGTPRRWSWCQCVMTICSRWLQPSSSMALSRSCNTPGLPSPASISMRPCPLPTRYMLVPVSVKGLGLRPRILLTSGDSFETSGKAGHPCCWGGPVLHAQVRSEAWQGLKLGLCGRR